MSLDLIVMEHGMGVCYSGTLHALYAMFSAMPWLSEEIQLSEDGVVMEGMDGKDVPVLLDNLR